MYLKHPFSKVNDLNVITEKRTVQMIEILLFTFIDFPVKKIILSISLIFTSDMVHKTCRNNVCSIK